MPFFLCQTFKTHAKGKWSNVYRTSATNITVLEEEFTSILTGLELPLLHSSVTLASIRYSSEIPHDTDFLVLPINLAGTSSDAGDLLPFFNCARVDVSVIGGGRPSRKYWKGLLTENLVTAQEIISGTISAVNTAFTAFIAAANDAGHAVVDPQHQDWDVASCIPAVQMRQMHRKRKKKVVTGPPS